MMIKVILPAVLMLWLGAASTRHIELVRSNPAADTVLSSAPSELLLTFSAHVDFERSAVTMRNNEESVRLSAAQKTDDPHQIKISILDEIGSGTYTVAWTAAPMDDHGSRGSYSFEVRSAP